MRYEILRDETSQSQEGDEESKTQEEVSGGISRGKKEIYIFCLT
jgi:hypothetical protein